MWCNHKWNKVSEDRYQYCEKCNKARFFSKKCNHFWEIIKEYEEDGDYLTPDKIFISRCKNCGELTKDVF